MGGRGERNLKFRAERKRKGEGGEGGVGGIGVSRKLSPAMKKIAKCDERFVEKKFERKGRRITINRR